MKKYVLYPGVGRVTPVDLREQYISGQQLAHCYRVPYSQCLDTSNAAIKKVMMSGAKFDNLIPLIPKLDGIYRIPGPEEKRIILVKDLHEQVKM